MSGGDAANKKSSWRDDVKILWHLVAHPIRGKSHAERLENFYSGQAEGYDSFRARMLHGRQEMIEMIPFPEGGVWYDLGAGTGENLRHAGDKANGLKEIHLVDLSSSLLKVAEKQVETLGLTNVQTHLADATAFDCPDQSVDVVTMSYSLTMIPDWFEAIAIAERILKPGGMIAIVDFFVSRKYAAEGHRQHGWLRRAFWSHWFASDNVYLSGDHGSMLHRRFDVEKYVERDGKVPYLPFVRAPYYQFLGRKGVPSAVQSES